MSVMESTFNELRVIKFQATDLQGSFYSARFKKLQLKCPVLKRKRSAVLPFWKMTNVLKRKRLAVLPFWKMTRMMISVESVFHKIAI